MASSWIFVALLLGVACCVLFKCGQWIREGVVLLRRAESGQMKEFEKKLTFGAAAVNAVKRNARLRILGPIGVLCMLYGLIAVECGVKTFLISLPLLFIVWLGSKRVNVNKLLMH